MTHISGYGKILVELLHQGHDGLIDQRFVQQNVTYCKVFLDGLQQTAVKLVASRIEQIRQPVPVGVEIIRRVEIALQSKTPTLSVTSVPDITGGI
jgi:hypothetical protein